MDKDGNITISNFQEGIADSPLFGFAKMQNIEIREKPGVAKIQYAPQLSFTPASLPVATIRDSYGNIYVGCEFGQFYKNGTLINTSQAIYDLKLISDATGEYVLISRQTDLAIYGPTNSIGAAFFSSWLSASLVSSYAKPILVGLDTSSNNTPYVYVGNGNTIGAISNFASGVVGVAPTGTWSSAVLTLSPGHYVRCFAALGKYLAIGTGGGASFYDAVNSKIAGFFLWDRTSTTFNLPVLFNENGVNQILQLQNKVFLVVGTRAKIYQTDSTNYTFMKRVPFNFNRQFGSSIFLYPNAIAQHLGQLLIGTSSFGDSYPSYSSQGVYGIFTDDTEYPPTYPISLLYTPSSGGNGQSQPMKIGCVYSTSQDQLYLGWQDGSTYGFDLVGYSPYSNYLAYLETPLYTVGDELGKRTYKRIDISLTKPLITGQKIRISYRETLQDAYTQIGEYTSTNFGTNTNYNTMANLASKVKLQFKVELTQTTPATVYNDGMGVNTIPNIELESITIRQGEK